ncbi:MAG: hypothetical protein IKZ96_00965 [Bacilli bacterium]|nr:hypothetical protein [Bacilli bacterium]
MERIHEFINILFSDNVAGSVYDFYNENSESLRPKWRDEYLFLKYYRANIIDTYIRAPKSTRDLLFNSFKDNNINTSLFSGVVENLNSYIAKEGERIYPCGIRGLFDYATDSLYEKLCRDDESIIEAIISECHLLTMDDVKESNPIVTGYYKFTPDEIKTLEKASCFPAIVDQAHLLYDEMGPSRELYCNYELIENDLFREYAFHTDNDNDVFNIIDANGRIIRYFQGDISFYDGFFSDLLILTKLYFIWIYRENVLEEEPDDEDDTFDEYDDAEKESMIEDLLKIIQDIPEKEKAEIVSYMDGDPEYESISPKAYERTMKKAIEFAWDKVQKASCRYSRRMIEMAQEDYQRVEKLIYTYKL